MQSRDASNFVPTVPNATLSSGLSSPATAIVNEPITFTSTITKAADSTTPNVRVMTTLTDLSQQGNVVYEYEASPGVYLPMTFTNGVAYYGASTGFPLMTATGNMRVTFKQPGVYQTTSQIVEAATNAPIGAAVAQTFTVEYRAVPTAANQSGQVVRESDFATSGWGFYNDSNDTATTSFGGGYGYAQDPANNGKDTLKFSHPTDKMSLATPQYANTALRDIAAIGYDSYNESGASTYIQFNVDLNGSGLWQNRLTYVPASTSGVWQSNEGVQNGNGLWQWSGNLNGTTPWPDGKVAQERTWNDIVASFPNARIAPLPLGGLFIRSEPGSVNYINNAYVVATATSNVKYNFMEDGYDPELAITSPATDGVIRAPGGAYTLTGTAADSGSGLDRIRVQVRNLTTNTQVMAPTTVMNFVGDNWSFDVPAGMFEDGNQYRITATAYDKWNNSTVERRTVTIDNTAPNGTLSQSGNSLAVTVTLNGLTEPIQTPAGWTQSGSDYAITHTVNGSYSVTLVDMVGNATTLNYDVTSIDEDAPILTNTTVTRNNNGTYTIAGQANEPLTSVRVRINNGTYETGAVSGATWSFTTEVLPDGVYTVDIQATDGVGRVGSATGYEFIATTPFIPVTQPLVQAAELMSIPVGVQDPSSTRRTAYVPSVNMGTTTPDNTGSILGTQTTKETAKKSTAAIEPSEEGWKLLGLAWYWWALIVGALAAAGWFGMNWYRGRGQA